MSGSVNQTVIQNSSYLISRNGIYYYSRRVPADLHKRFNKDRVIISLRTRSQDKALRSAATLSDRLEQHWESRPLRQPRTGKNSRGKGAQIVGGKMFDGHLESFFSV